MPLQRPFLHAVLHLFQFMATVTGESLCPSQVAQAPICWHQSVTRERFGIFLAELAAATQLVRDQGCLVAVLQMLQTSTFLLTSHQAAMSMQGQLSQQASWPALATGSCTPTQVCLNVAALDFETHPLPGAANSL